MDRIKLTSKEQLAQQITGLETEAINFAMNSDRDLDTIIKKEAASKFNQAVDDYTQKFSDYQKTLQEAGEKLAANMNSIECKPLFDKIHVVPYATNPFQKVTKEGNIILDLGGANPEYKSNETGQIEEEEAYIIVGDVVEVGPDVKYVKPGDAVMYIRPNQIMVPLYNTGLMCISERSIIAVINEGLTERFKNVDNGK